jgi:hypothetical protein
MVMSVNHGGGAQTRRPARPWRGDHAGGGPVAAPAPPRNPSLEEALRRGPFELALRTALEQRGLSLQSLQRRLRAEGASISLAALSYWQRGLRRPERPESLRVVFAVERILELQRGSLVALLGPPRPRGRRSAPAGGVALLEFDDMIGPQPGLVRVLEDVDVGVNLAFRHLGVHGDIWLGADRTWFLERVKRVVVAERDEVDRFVAVFEPDAPQPPPVVRPLAGCRLGRVKGDAESGFHVAELLFDRALRAGEAFVFEYEYVPGGPAVGIDRYHHTFRQRVQQTVLRAHFDPRALPVRCARVMRRRFGDDLLRVREVPVSACGVADVVDLDSGPGLVGFRWQWE